MPAAKMSARKGLKQWPPFLFFRKAEKELRRFRKRIMGVRRKHDPVTLEAVQSPRALKVRSDLEAAIAAIARKRAA